MNIPNRISATLSTEDLTEIDKAITVLQAKLPFLVGLTPEERKYLPKMGDKSRAFVLRALEVGQKNEGMLPRAFDLEEMRRDVQLYQALYPIYLAVSQLGELIDDSLTEIGSESYAAALVVYNAAKTNGQASGLDEALDDLGKRFARKSKKVEQKP
jgi:hypothetical protein